MPRVPVIIAAAGLVVAACGSGSTPSPSSAASGGASAPPGSAVAGGSCTAATADSAATTVTIEGFAYSPTTVTISAGEAVAWTNADDAPHTATSTSGGCDTRSIPKGQTVALQFDTAGTYTYRCTIHPSMPQATVEVTS